MTIMLTPEYKITCDSMGWTLYALITTEDKKTGADKQTWRTEGYYGDLSQAVTGAYRHKLHEKAIQSIEELKRLENDFRREITAYVQKVVDAVESVEPDESDEDAEGGADE